MAKEFDREENFKLGELSVNLSCSAVVVPFRDTLEARQVSLWKR